MRQSNINSTVYKLNDFEFVDYEPSKHKEQVIEVMVEAYLVLKRFLFYLKSLTILCSPRSI